MSVVPRKAAQRRIAALSLWADERDRQAEETARRIWFIGNQLWSASLNLSPNGLALHERMNNPQPGDLVIVWLIRRGDEANAVGRFLRVEDVPLHDEETGEEYGPERRYIIERIGRPGDEFSWTNVQLLAVPDMERWSWWRE